MSASQFFELTVPVKNEAAQLEPQLRTLRAALDRIATTNNWEPVQICVAVNGSTDETLTIARSLQADPTMVISRVLDIPAAGKGNAIRTAWLGSNAVLVGFTDIDQAADIDALPDFVNAILPAAKSPTLPQPILAVASRYLPGSTVERSGIRTLTSHGYRMLVQLLLGNLASDLQCGLKVANRKRIRPVLEAGNLPGWGFDTELVLLSRLEGGPRAVHEVPVRWKEGERTSVSVYPVAKKMLVDVLMLKLGLVNGSIVRRLERSRRTSGPRTRS